MLHVNPEILPAPSRALPPGWTTEEQLNRLETRLFDRYIAQRSRRCRLCFGWFQIVLHKHRTVWLAYRRWQLVREVQNNLSQLTAFDPSITVEALVENNRLAYSAHKLRHYRWVCRKARHVA